MTEVRRPRVLRFMRCSGWEMWCGRTGWRVCKGGRAGVTMGGFFGGVGACGDGGLRGMGYG
jgi:hypothetical protein